MHGMIDRHMLLINTNKNSHQDERNASEVLSEIKTMAFFR